MKINPVSMTDFYKTGHKFQYPEGTALVYSNATCRSDKHFKGLDDFDHKVVNFGLQGICQWLLIDYWNENFFNKPKREAVMRHKRTLERALNVKDFDVSHLEALHDLGFLPVCIKALPEGARVNIKVPVYTIVNTHFDFFWLTNYLETQIQSESWKCKVAATTAYEFRRMFSKYAEETGVDQAFVDFQGHDFSMRGMSGVQDATQCGAAHLLSFKGTDTVSAIEYLEDYYQGLGGVILKDEDSETIQHLDDVLTGYVNAGVKRVVELDSDGIPEIFNIIEPSYGENYNLESVDSPVIPFIGGSVPATEHAVTSMRGNDGELDLFRDLITNVYPNGIVSLVSDTYDFWDVMSNKVAILKDEIMARDGKVVFRPDSGDPVDIICGTALNLDRFATLDEAFDYFIDTGESLDFERSDSNEFVYNNKYYEIDYDEELGEDCPREIEPTPEMKGAVECLWDVFGGTTTDKGFKTLDQHVGLIYGDSINLDRANRILEGLKAKGFSSANIVFGIGSFTYQFVTRDTLGEAVKATFGVVNGEAREIFKDPKTGDGGKKSAKGLIRVERLPFSGDYIHLDQQTWEQEAEGELKDLFVDGKMVRIDSLENIRKRLLG